jgi:hypothetical protein
VKKSLAPVSLQEEERAKRGLLLLLSLSSLLHLPSTAEATYDD